MAVLLALPAGSKRTVTPTTAGFHPAVYLANSCSPNGQWCGVAPDAGMTASWSGSSIGTVPYYVFVEGMNGTSGGYTLRVARSP